MKQGRTSSCETERFEKVSRRRVGWDQDAARKWWRCKVESVWGGGSCIMDSGDTSSRETSPTQKCLFRSLCIRWCWSPGISTFEEQKLTTIGLQTIVIIIIMIIIIQSEIVNTPPPPPQGVPLSLKHRSVSVSSHSTCLHSPDCAPSSMMIMLVTLNVDLFNTKFQKHHQFFVSVWVYATWREFCMGWGWRRAGVIYFEPSLSPVGGEAIISIGLWQDCIIGMGAGVSFIFIFPDICGIQ